MKDDWNWFDWLLCFFPIIAYVAFMCYNAAKSEGVIGTIDNIIFALITGGISIAGIVIGALLKHFLYDRKQCKNLLEKLGKFEGMSMEAAIGVFQAHPTSITQRIGNTEEHGSLTRQHDEITKQIGNTSEHGSITAQIGKVNRFVDKQTERQALIDRHLNDDQRKDAQAVEALGRLSAQLAGVQKENGELRAKIDKLERTVERQRDIIETLKQDTGIDCDIPGERVNEEEDEQQP